MTNDVIKNWIGSPPETCNLCNRTIIDYFVDGRVNGRSSWANMCKQCHIDYGVGFGVGKGQAYKRVVIENSVEDVRTFVKVAG